MKCRHSIISFLYYWLPPILFCVFIYSISSMSCISIGPSLPYIDKVYHFILYFILALLLYRALSHTLTPVNRQYGLWMALILTILYGCSDEIHQYFVPLRKADIWDLLFDAVGACVAIFSILYIKNLTTFYKRGKDAGC